MRDILLFGIQWSGKGTQAHLLTEAFPDKFWYFSSGDIFRAIMSSDNAIGNYLRNRMDSGELINDEVTNSLFKTYFYTVLHDHKFMLLDGFPRTIPQMKEMIKLTELHERPLIGVQLVLPDDVAIERIKERWRADDTDEGIKYRIDQFYEKTQPTIDWFAENVELIQVDANRSVEEIAEDLKAIALGA